MVERLNAALVNAGSNKVLRERLEAQGVDLHVSSAQELTARSRGDTAQWDKIIQDARIELH